MMLSEFIATLQERLKEYGDLPVVVESGLEVDWENVEEGHREILNRYVKVVRPLHCLAEVGIAQHQLGVPDSICIPILPDTTHLDMS